ncbi:LemA family protein [Asanoa sp. NPDC049573]|uniref:LemA family protein n=1 Tax=Asanoa sp. NPDC049573 TaxID=3155396 RepID=UPI0034357D07
MNLSPLVIAIIVVAVIAVLVLFWAVHTFNVLIRQRNQVRASWAQIDVQLKRRHDLVPNLVETVKGYAGHERATLEAVVAARAGAMAAGASPSVEQRSAAEGLLTQSLGRLFALVEAYPDLKASQNFLHLQSELANTEDKIAYARQFYNTAVQTLDNTAHSFPSMFVAPIAGIKPAGYFQASGAEQAPVQVRF